MRNPPTDRCMRCNEPFVRKPLDVGYYCRDCHEAFNQLMEERSA